MTFIASVLATEGIAIVADSFVTTPSFSMDFADFVHQVQKTKKGTIKVKDLFPLFQNRPGYTRNYAEKLFQFDQYSAITTAGNAFINKKEIKELVREIQLSWEATPSYATLPIKDKLKHIVKCVEAECVLHINDNNVINETVFIFSHYNITENKPQVFKIKIHKTTKDELAKGKTGFVDYTDETVYGVITDGQDYVIDRFLFGSMYRHATRATNKIVESICKELKSKKKTKQRIYDMLEKEKTLQESIHDDFRVINLRTLSLQEAVDFAALLLRVVMDIQVYTEKIPTVGGRIKLAIISKENGFNYISGNTIEKPKLVY